MQILSKLSFRSLWLHIVHIYNTKPIYRGMLSYAIIWPTSNLINQTVSGRKHYDFNEAFRFCLFGCFYVAPCLYIWIRFLSMLWPRSNFRTAFYKAIVEQFTYSPFAMTSFFFGMSLLEGKTIGEGIHEVTSKFIPTFKMAFMVWPTLQTINFTFISEKNRVPYVSLCSLGWTCYLSYMKHKDSNRQSEATQTLTPCDSKQSTDFSSAVRKQELERSFTTSLNTVDLSSYNKLVKLTLKS